MFSMFMQTVSDTPELSATFEGKAIAIRLTDTARHALAARKLPLIAEMELYFSCLIRMQVRFYDGDPALTATPVNEQLAIRFRPVMSERCDMHAVEGKPALKEFPIVRRQPFVPRWLNLDFKKGKWVGEFGYKSGLAH
jgi:hypothetical protein